MGWVGVDIFQFMSYLGYSLNRTLQYICFFFFSINQLTTTVFSSSSRVATVVTGSSSNRAVATAATGPQQQQGSGCCCRIVSGHSCSNGGHGDGNSCRASAIHYLD